MTNEDVQKLLVIIFPRKYWNNLDPVCHWVGPCEDAGETGARPKDQAPSSKKRKIISQDNSGSHGDQEDNEDHNGSEDEDGGGQGPSVPVYPQNQNDDRCDVCMNEAEASCQHSNLKYLSENEILVAKFTIAFPVRKLCPRHWKKTFNSFRGQNKICPDPLDLEGHQRRTTRLQELSLDELADIKRYKLICNL